MNIFRHEAIEAPFSWPLHAMRAIAVLIIFACHMTNRVKIASYGYHYSDSLPFNIYGAVTFFFVLSGLVLAISLAKADLTAKSYILFLVRRFFRIMPLMIVTVTIGWPLSLSSLTLICSFRPCPNGMAHSLRLSSFPAILDIASSPTRRSGRSLLSFSGCVLLPFMVATTGRNKMLVIVCGGALLLFSAFNLELTQRLEYLSHRLLHRRHGALVGTAFRRANDAVA